MMMITRVALSVFFLCILSSQRVVGFIPTHPNFSRPLSQIHAVVDPEGLDSLTPIQIKVLRKEVSKRRARNKLPTIYCDDLEDDLTQVLELLREQELLELRAIRKDDKKQVFATAEEIGYLLSEHSEQPVFLLDIKGHSAVYFRPNGTIPVRTTGKQNDWVKRPRKARDSYGQIIINDDQGIIDEE